MTLKERIFSTNDILLADGAMGTELQKRGLESGACPELLNLTHPEIVRSVHKDYISAGADIIETNTFGANRARLKLHDSENLVREIVLAAAENVRGLSSSVYIAGSMGPLGDLIEPLGLMSSSEAYDIFAEQASAFGGAKVDVIFIETMMAPEEILIAIKAVKENTELPVAALMTFEHGQVGYRTMWGTSVAEAALLLTDAGADIIGSNCGKGFDEMTGVIGEFKKATSKPLLAMANAGIPVWEEGKSIYRETPEMIAGDVRQIIESGVRIIGGCCGTNPDHIREMRKILNLYQK
ncbi:MAG: homocysteine S-methyltransferase family protein [Ignavibacteriaceae bacterium]|nr:homocysteine S-methyltransferase family protein [Ignavibacteriaceae bacterium]